MAKKKDLRTILRKELGEELADSLLAKVNRMAKAGESEAQIEISFLTDLTRHLERQATAIGEIAVESMRGLRDVIAVESKKWSGTK